MFYALVYFPEIESKEFHEFRNKYEPFAGCIPEHIPLVFPVQDTINEDQLKDHIANVLNDFNPFDIHISGYYNSPDQWLFLVLKEGNDKVIELHDRLYTGILSKFLRKDLPYTPHIALGLFSNEKYNAETLVDELTFNLDKYQIAVSELEKLELDLWRNFDRLNLVKLNQNFTKCSNIYEFTL
jgi:2'-5' RNA ligase